jgi:hypothetical protein
MVTYWVDATADVPAKNVASNEMTINKAVRDFISTPSAAEATLYGYPAKGAY